MGTTIGTDTFTVYYGQESGLGRSQRPEALAVAEEPFHRGVIALNAVVAPLPIDMSDTARMRVITLVDLADNTPVGQGFIGDDGDWPAELNTLNRLVQKGPCGFCLPPGGQAKVDQLPFASTARVG